MKIAAFLADFDDSVWRPLQVLERDGHSLVILSPDDDDDKVRRVLAEAEIIVSANEAWDAERFAAAPRLKAIARFGVGYDNVPLDIARAHDVIVSNVPGANANAVAEMALGLIIASLRRLSEQHESVAAGEWSRQFGEELAGKTVGLVGFGNVAQRLARKLSGLGVTIKAYDPFMRADVAQRLGVEAMSLEELRGEADILSLHLPSTAETENMIDAEFLRAMKAGSYLVNTARGTLVVEAALAEAVSSGHLSGAAVDVYQQEPPTRSPLLGVPRILTLPHAAGLTNQMIAETATVTIDAIRAVAAGEQPKYALTEHRSA